MNTQKKIVHYHIDRLKDREVSVRMDAIRELREIGDPESLPALQDVFAHDEDLNIRRAAQNAGREIFLKLREVRK